MKAAVGHGAGSLDHFGVRTLGRGTAGSTSLRVTPARPAAYGPMRVEGLEFGGGRVDLDLAAYGSVTVLQAPAGYRRARARVSGVTSAESQPSSQLQWTGSARTPRRTYVTLLDSIDGPDDVKALDPSQLDQLAQEIRDFLVTVGLADRRAPRPQPRRRRADHGDPPGLRLARATGSSSTPATRPTCTSCSPAGRPTSTRCARKGGLSGYPSQAESEHDIVENSHASTALSYADGLAKAYAIRGEDRHVVAVIGDGALTGGMAWEALNNIAVDQGPAGWSSSSTTTAAPTPRPSAASPTTSPRLRTNPRYEQVLDLVKRRAQRASPVVGPRGRTTRCTR